jgi:hypothetical protein
MAACSSDPVSPQHGSRLPTALLGAVFFGRSIPRDSVCWGWGTCSLFGALVVRRAMLLAASRPGSRPRTSIDASREQSRRRSRSDPLQVASGAACVRRGPQCTDSIAVSCPAGLRWRRSGPGAPEITARGGARPGASVWLLRVGWRMQPHEQHGPNVERTAQASGFWHSYDILCRSSSREID